MPWTDWLSGATQGFEESADVTPTNPGNVTGDEDDSHVSATLDKGAGGGTGENTDWHYLEEFDFGADAAIDGLYTPEVTAIEVRADGYLTSITADPLLNIHLNVRSEASDTPSAADADLGTATISASSAGTSWQVADEPEDPTPDPMWGHASISRTDLVADEFGVYWQMNNYGGLNSSGDMYLDSIQMRVQVSVTGSALPAWLGRTELITTPTFPASSWSGWTDASIGTGSVASAFGVLLLGNTTGTAPNTAEVRETASVTAGKSYQLTVEKIVGSTIVAIGTSAGASDIYSGTDDTTDVSTVLTAATTETWHISLKNVSQAGLAQISIASLGELANSTVSGAGEVVKTGSGTLASHDDLVTNGDFATDSDWSKQPGWTISGGKANYTGEGTAQGLGQPQDLVEGQSYYVSYDIDSISGGVVRAVLGGGPGALHSSSGKVEEYVDSGAGSTLAILGGPATVAVIDNIVLRLDTDSHVSGTGEVARTGSGSLLSQEATASGTGEREITGSGAPAADEAATSGAGTVTGVITGSGVLASQASAVSGTGEREVAGSGAPAAGEATTSGTGAVTGVTTGSGILASQASAVAGQGEREVTGSGAPAADSSETAGTGSVAGVITGSGILAAQTSSMAGLGEREITGSGSAVADTSTASGSGQVGSTITGTGAIIAQESTVSGVGTRIIPGSGVLVSDESTVSGVGVRETPGSGAIAPESPSIAGTGEREVTGSGAAASQESTTSGAGSIEGAISGSGELAAQVATTAGTGERIITGAGTPAADNSATAGTGQVSGEVTGSGSLVAQVVVVSGAGEREIAGTGALTAANDSTVSGTGERVVPGTGDLEADSSSIAGTGLVQSVGSGALEAQDATTAGVGQIVHTGSGALAANESTMFGLDPALESAIPPVGTAIHSRSKPDYVHAVARSGLVYAVKTG